MRKYFFLKFKMISSQKGQSASVLFPVVFQASFYAAFQPFYKSRKFQSPQPRSARRVEISSYKHSLSLGVAEVVAPGTLLLF